MTLAELQSETLTQKHSRLMRAKCPHEEIYSSSVWSRDEGKTFTNKACLDCGQTWHSETSD